MIEITGVNEELEIVVEDIGSHIVENLDFEKGSDLGIND